MSRIPNKSESFKKDYTIETYIIKDETGETKEYRLIDKNCNVIAKLVEKDGEFNESSATTDAQNSGLFEDFAKKFGFKDDIQLTTMQSRIENIEELKKSMASRLKKAINSRLAKGDVIDMFNRKKKDVDSRSKDDKIKEALRAQGNRGKNKERSMEDLKREAQSRQIPKDAKYISSHDPVYGEHHSDGHNPNHINFYLANHFDDKTSGIHATMPDGSNFDDEAYNHIESGDFDSYIDEAQSNGFQSIILHPNDNTAYSGRDREHAMKLLGPDKDLDKGYTPESIEKLKDGYRPEDPKITFVKKIRKIKENNKPKDTSDAALERKVRERYDLSKDDNTLDYSKLNNPQERKKKEAPSLDYSKMSSPASQSPKWKRDLEIKRSAQQKALDAQGKTKEAPRQKTAIEEIREKHNLNKSLELLQKLAKSKRLAKGDVINMFNRKKKDVDTRSKEDKINEALKTHGRGQSSGIDTERMNNINASLSRIDELIATNAKDKANQGSRRSEEFRKKREAGSITAIPTEKKRPNDELLEAREKELASLDRKDPLYVHKRRFGVEKVENALKEAVEANRPYARIDDGIVPNYDYKISNKIGSGKPEKFGDDPFGWHDSKHKISKGALEHNQGYNSPVEIHTSSDLLSQDDYANSIPKGSRIHIYKQTDDNDEIGNNGWPSNQRLERVAEKLKSMGHDVKLYPHSLKMIKSNEPHAPNSPEDKAHDIQEQSSSIKSSLDVLRSSGKIRDMFKHLRSLKNKENHRNPENIKAGSLKKDMKVPIRD